MGRITLLMICRWIRDQLLTFQDMVSSYNRFLLQKSQSLLSTSTASLTDTEILVQQQALKQFVEKLTDKDIDEEEIDLFVFSSLTSIRHEFISQRMNVEVSQTVDAIPSFDEYVR
jgi:hypothetical protein